MSGPFSQKILLFMLRKIATSSTKNSFDYAQRPDYPPVTTPQFSKLSERQIYEYFDSDDCPQQFKEQFEHNHRQISTAYANWRSSADNILEETRHMAINAHPECMSRSESLSIIEEYLKAFEHPSVAQVSPTELSNLTDEELEAKDIYRTAKAVQAAFFISRNYNKAKNNDHRRRKANGGWL